MRVNIYTVHPSGLFTRTPNQHAEPLDSVAPLIRYKAPLIFSYPLFGLRSREDSYWWGDQTHALSSRCANAAKRLCRSARVLAPNV